MASGHAKYTGRVGVCLATQGPGAIHLLAGLYDAKLDGRPVVAIVGRIASTALGSGYLQEVDLHSLYKDVCGQYVQTVATPEQLPMLIDNAMRTAMAESTPVCLIVPHDVQRAEMPERTLALPAEVPAHLSSYLASMGCAMPYGLAAKFDAPDRPAVALVGDGAMQMNGLLELITVADRWQSWADPRFVVLVLHNGDLSEVSWEQREMEGDPRFPASQRVPSFPYAGYAELLGLRGIRVDHPDMVKAAWQQAFSADRPVVVEAIVDPAVPLLPPHLQEGKVASTRRGLEQEPGSEQATAQLDRQRKDEGLA